MIDPARALPIDMLAAEMPDTSAPAPLLSMSEDEFRLFHTRTARPLWGYLTRALGGDETAADDLVQESYLRLLGATLPPQMSDEHRKNYLYRIATNLVRDRARGRTGTTEVELEDGAGSERPFAGAVEAGHDVQRALARLRPRERQLLWLAYIERFSHEEIAGLVGAKTPSIRPMLARARARMASFLTGGLLP